MSWRFLATSLKVRSLLSTIETVKQKWYAVSEKVKRN